VIPKNAAGHGPVDYVLLGDLELLVVKGKISKKHAREEEEEEEDDGVDEEEEGEESSREKNTRKTLPTSFAQLIGQALDSMLEGAFFREGVRVDGVKVAYPTTKRRYCVLSSGQRYFFFRLEHRSANEPLPSLTFLGLYRFRYFSNRYILRSSHDGKISEDEYRNVIAALLVCIYDGKGVEALTARLQEMKQAYDIESQKDSEQSKNVSIIEEFRFKRCKFSAN
jgi:hypothetical protein